MDLRSDAVLFVLRKSSAVRNSVFSELRAAEGTSLATSG